MKARTPAPTPEVLVADDDPIALEILQLHLQHLGCVVHVATDGHQALSILKATAERLRLIVLDLCMPGPLAEKLYQHVRAQAPAVPVLFCSAFSNADVLDFLAPEDRNFLPKPFGIEDVSKALSRLLHRSEPAFAGKAAAL